MNDPAPPSVSSLVFALRAAAVDPNAVANLKLRVHSRLSNSLLGLAPAATAGSAGASSTSLLPPATSRVAAAAKASKSIVLAALAPVFALGVLTGVAAEHWHSRKDAAQHTTSPANAPVVATAPSAPLDPQESVVTPDQLALELPSKPRASANSTASTDPASSLAAERSLLDQARQALARGEPGAGLGPLARHTARFPKGVLTEEREALAVRLLAAAGNVTAATTRAEAFRRRFPNSLFTPAVENAVLTISRQSAEGVPKP